MNWQSIPHVREKEEIFLFWSKSTFLLCVSDLIFLKNIAQLWHKSNEKQNKVSFFPYSIYLWVDGMVEKKITFNFLFFILENRFSCLMLLILFFSLNFLLPDYWLLLMLIYHVVTAGCEILKMVILTVVMENLLFLVMRF